MKFLRYEVINKDVNNSGDVAEPCGTVARPSLDVDCTCRGFSCWDVLSRKLWIQSHRCLHVFLDFSLVIKME